MNKSYEEIVSKAVKGDKQALFALIKREQENIYTTLYYLKQNDDEINDLVQNVLIKLTTKIKQLKNPLYFKTWLNQIILNTYYDYLRKNKKQAEIILTDKISDFDREYYRNNPQESALYNEMDMIIKHTISNLPMQYKVPIALREIQGLSYSDISNITKTSLGTVKSRISRARNIIKSEIEKYAKD